MVWKDQSPLRELAIWTLLRSGERGFGAKIDLLHLMGSSSAFHNWSRYDKPTYIAHFGVTYVSSWSPAGDGGSSTLLIIVTGQRHMVIRNYARFFQLATFLNGASQRGKGFSQPKQRVATAPLEYTKKSVTWCNTVGTAVSTVNCQKERERRRFIERRTSPGAGIRARLDSRLLGYTPRQLQMNQGDQAGAWPKQCWFGAVMSVNLRLCNVRYNSIQRITWDVVGMRSVKLN